MSASVGLSQKFHSFKRVCWGAGWLLFFVVPFFAKGQPALFDFASFTSSQQVLLLGGSATVESNRLIVARGGEFRGGGAWFRDKVSVDAGFETVFQVRILPQTDISKGFALMLHGDVLPGLGHGSGLGYEGMKNSVAVEFDLEQNANYPDPPAPHVSVQTCGIYANSALPAATLGSSGGLGTLSDGNLHTMRVRYAAGKMDVTVDGSLALSVDIDLKKILRLDRGQAWIGFVAGANAGEGPVEILSWSFTPSAGPIAVAMTDPAPGAQFISGAIISLSATASSSTGSIVRVEFYTAEELIGQTASAPFGLQWSNAVPRQHVLTAVGYDSFGNRSVSAPLRISVIPSQPPIGINFATGLGGTNFLIAPSDLAGVVRHGNWNNVVAGPTAGGTLSTIRSSSSALTPVVVTYQFTGPGEELTVNPTASADHRFMRAHLADFARPAGQTNSLITISEVPYPVYDVILYSDGGNNAYDRVVEFEVGGESIFLRDAAWTAFSGHYAEARGTVNLGQSTAAGNYVRFRSLTNRTVNVVISERSAASIMRRAAVNGLQIVPSIAQRTVPEPRVVRGPYLQSGTARSMTVCWRTDLPTPTTISYGTVPGALNLTVSNDTGVRDHLVTLTNLQPNTRYYYAIDPAVTNPPTADLNFVTSPQTARPFRIWAMGDAGTADHSAAKVRDAFLDHAGPRKPDLLMLLGDNAYEYGSDAEYQVALFEMFAPVLSQAVVWSCMGNHETYSLDLPYLSIFYFPTNGAAGGVSSGSELYYSFNYANAHFVCLETTIADRSPNGPMAAWLREDLAANTSEWLIVYCHVPPYSKGSHDSDSEFEIEMSEMRSNFVPIFDEYGVDLVLSGNSHGYERSYLVAGHYGLSDTFLPSMIRQGGSGRPEDTGAYVKPLHGAVPNSGAVYVVAGNGGIIRSDWGLNHPAMFRGLARLGSVMIDIDGPTLEFRMVTENGSVGDHFTMRKGVTTNAIAQVSLTAVDGLLDESASAGTSLMVSRSEAGDQDLQVFYNLSGAAKNGVDYAHLDASVTIPAGDNQVVLPLVPQDDLEHEGAEDIAVTLSPNTAPFRVALLPDTSAYAAETEGGSTAMLAAQTRWIADSAAPLGIRLVLHSGNVTRDNTPTEWQRVQTQFGSLPDLMPCTLALGERDGLSGPIGQTDPFNAFFPVNQLRQTPGFGGVFESNRAENIYFYFTGGGIDWLVLALEFGPRDAVVAWANRIVAAHPQRKVIVLTHAQVAGDDLWHGTSVAHSETPAEFGRRNNGMELWHKLLRRHPNIALVLSGSADDGSGQRVDEGDYGNAVVQISTDFSSQLNGGNGYLRLLQFVPDEDKLVVSAYSPYLDADGTSFEISNLGIFKPWLARYVLQPPTLATVILQDNDGDVSPPAVTKVAAIGKSNQIVVTFSEPVDRATAENLDNYQLASGPVIQSAQLLADGRTVVLTTSEALLENVTLNLNLSGVSDLAIPPNVVPSAAVPFVHRLAWLFDDFSDGDLAGWTIVDEGNVAGPSVWKVPAGKLDQSSEIFGPTSGAVVGRKGTMALWTSPGASNWENYLYKATLRTPDPDGIGLVFCYVDTNNLYRLELDARLGVRKLLLISNGVESTLAVAVGGFPLNANFVVQVEISPRGIYPTLDGQPLFGGVVPNRTLSQGTAGLYCWQNAGATFDDVEVAPLRMSALLNPSLAGSGQFEFDLLGPSGARFAIEASSDLQTWTEVTTVTNAPADFRFSAPAGAPGEPRFYRARRLP